MVIDRHLQITHVHLADLHLIKRGRHTDEGAVKRLQCGHWEHGERLDIKSLWHIQYRPALVPIPGADPTFACGSSVKPLHAQQRVALPCLRARRQLEAIVFAPAHSGLQLRRFPVKRNAESRIDHSASDTFVSVQINDNATCWDHSTEVLSTGELFWGADDSVPVLTARDSGVFFPFLFFGVVDLMNGEQLHFICHCVAPCRYRQRGTCRP